MELVAQSTISKLVDPLQALPCKQLFATLRHVTAVAKKSSHLIAGNAGKSDQKYQNRFSDEAEILRNRKRNKKKNVTANKMKRATAAEEPKDSTAARKAKEKTDIGNLLNGGVGKVQTQIVK